jgi:hypothetical protein
MSPHNAPRRLHVNRATRLALLLTATLGASLLVGAPASAQSCPNEQVRSESDRNPVTGEPYSAQLPDCRAYELVSPPNTEGMPAVLGNGYSISNQFLATSDGPVFWQSGATPPGTGALPNGGYVDVFRSSRTNSGWMSKDLVPHSQAGAVLLLAASINGASALVETTLPLNAEDHDDPTGNVTIGNDLYVIREGGVIEFVTHGEVPVGATRDETRVGNNPRANPDVTAVGFETNYSLATPISDEQSTAGCYIWADVAGPLAEPTDLDEEGTAKPGRNCTYFGVAADGRPIIRVTNGRQGNGEIFAVDPGSIFQLSGGTQHLAGSEASFVAMSPDAKTVYIEAHEELAPEPAGETAPNIYAVGLDGLPTTCVSCAADGSVNSAQPEYVGQSADGSHIYFTVSGTLYQHDASGTQELAPAAAEIRQVVPSQNGDYVIASTSSALLSSDTNGTPDLYELHAGTEPELITGGAEPSTGGYHAVAASNTGERALYEASEGELRVIDEWVGGQTGQISPLHANRNYGVLGTKGPELEDVFFASNEPLVTQDENAGTTDIYDARVDGGFPAPAADPNDNQTPDPQVVAPTPYPASLTPPTVVLAPLAADTSIPSKTSQPSPTHAGTASRLARALKICRGDKGRKKRRSCEVSARSRYRSKPKTL